MLPFNDEKAKGIARFILSTDEPLFGSQGSETYLRAEACLIRAIKLSSDEDQLDLKRRFKLLRDSAKALNEVLHQADLLDFCVIEEFEALISEINKELQPLKFNEFLLAQSPEARSNQGSHVISTNGNHPSFKE